MAILNLPRLRILWTALQIAIWIAFTPPDYNKNKIAKWYGYIQKGLRETLESEKMVKAVMVYIKVVLKPPSASHKLSKLSRKPKKRKYVYREKQKGIKHIQSEASNKRHRSGKSPKPS